MLKKYQADSVVLKVTQRAGRGGEKAAQVSTSDSSAYRLRESRSILVWFWSLASLRHPLSYQESRLIMNETAI